MTPDRLYTNLRKTHENLELLIGDESAKHEWPLVTASMAALSDDLEKAAGSDANPYGVFLQHAAIVLAGGIQAMQLTEYSDDESEKVNVLIVIATAIAGLMRTVATCFVWDGEFNHD